MSMMNISRLGMKVLGLVAVLALFLPATVAAQTSIATGSIVGTVTDATGAVLPNAKVTTTGPTGQTASAVTNSTGGYSLGALIPGAYHVRIEAKGFKTLQLALDVRVDNAANGSAKLEIGQESTVVEVQSSEVQVNTEQATVQGVLTANQIENLPVNGRNFLDLAQLEPGVQIQDGQNFDPTKAGYSSISFGGRYGRTARIEVDGVDVSDETVGTTTTDIPASGIQEFQIGQASLDMSTELTSSGSVNVTTKSGTNAIHGEAFGQFRDYRVGWANLPGGANPYSQRSQYGGDLGGPIIKDKAFFFLDGERTVQNTQTPVPVSAPFQAYSGNFSDPFREDNLLGRLDYQLTKSARLFGRYSYFKNLLGATFGLGYAEYDNKDITRNTVVGLDFSTGAFTHSVRFSYLKFQNQIVDAGNSSLPFSNIGAIIFMGSTGLIAGSNYLAPQSTPQSDHEFKYDGSRVLGSHIVRYGVTFNHLQGGGFASFFKDGPLITSQVTTADIATAATGPFPGGSGNPLNYPADGNYVLGNGLGYSTTKAALGFPAGGLGPDNRILLYLGDSWKIKSNFTLTYGLRYERDTGRTDSQYPAIAGLNDLIPGLGNTVTQPNKNFGPDLGFAWDPMKNGKTSIRGGIGLFWENAIWNNVLFDGPFREATGAFLSTPTPCSAAGQAAPIQTSTGTITPSSGTPTSVCGTSGGFPLIGNALPALLALQAQLQAASPLDLQQSNPAYAGQYLSGCSNGSNCFFQPGTSMFNPNYRSPRSVVMNIGIQRELHPGMVLSADFIRNVQTHFLLGVDQNHAGDVRYFNAAGATAAITTTEANCGNGNTVASTYASPCLNDPGNGTSDGGTYGTAANPARIATIADYAGQGLGSSSDMGGNSCLAALGHACAFGGVNPLAPPMSFLSPVGRSVYDGLEMKWIDNVKAPFRGARNLNFQVSYALSRFDNSGGGVGAGSTVTAGAADQDFINPALDNANVNRYFGPSTLDRTHQISFGGYVDTRGGFEFGVMSHFYSPFAITPTVPNTGLGAGEIFRTDFDGDGTTQDPIPGARVGSFDRGVNAKSINGLISNFNANVVGQPTPAGNTLVQSGMMTSADLTALGGVGNGGNPLPLAPVDQVNYPWLKAFDAKISWNHTFRERFTIQPSVGFYNLFNFANFDLPTSMMSGLLTGSTGSINGTNYAGQLVNRVGVGTGVYTLGSPRETEFGLKINF